MKLPTRPVDFNLLAWDSGKNDAFIVRLGGFFLFSSSSPIYTISDCKDTAVLLFSFQMASTKSETTLDEAEKAVHARQDGSEPFDQHEYQVPRSLCKDEWFLFYLHWFLER
jgi:hypothetical protein